MSEPCEHWLFQSQVNVFRLTDGEGGKVTGYTAEVEIRCLGCESPMLFLGLPVGSRPDYPTVSFDRRQLRAPVEPSW